MALCNQRPHILTANGGLSSIKFALLAAGELLTRILEGALTLPSSLWPRTTSRQGSRIGNTAIPGGNAALAARDRVLLGCVPRLHSRL